MEFGGVDLPPFVRNTVGELFKQAGQHTLTYPASEAIINALGRIDRLQIAANKILKSFLRSQSENPENNQGWSEVRHYVTPGTGFDILSDPIAPNTLVVAKSFRTAANTGREHLYHIKYSWISGEKFKFGLPLFYSTSTSIYNDFDLRWPMSPEVFELRITSHADARDIAQKRFYCTEENHEQSGMVSFKDRSEIEVWKQGKSLRTKNLAKKSPASQFSTALPNPSPI